MNVFKKMWVYSMWGDDDSKYAHTCKYKVDILFKKIYIFKLNLYVHIWMSPKTLFILCDPRSWNVTSCRHIEKQQKSLIHVTVR